MKRPIIPLKFRVRYEGRVKTFDRRTDLEKLPNPLWHTVGQALRSKFHKPILGDKPGKPSSKSG